MAAYEMSVSVVTQYLQEQSNPDQANFVFAYTITIKNTGTVSAQVISRHWIITDAKNHIEEVKGLGVVGHQPFLPPGQSFEYTSGSSLTTPQGSMKGSYFCVA
ncbi:MAG: Co2+/Mg2+ efflux protein ApaG, partial [Burkholderiaceae bacterium]|nr:Co2+/Mg2+ efflux protein ApaG [Burkholderiaceae bacterium]